MTDLTRRKKELLNSYNNLCSCYGDIISEQTKTINQLKELLSKCLDELAEFNNSYYPETQELFSQITNAIGEK